MGVGEKGCGVGENGWGWGEGIRGQSPESKRGTRAVEWGGGWWGENCTWTKTYLLILEGEGPAGPTLPWPPRQSSL